MKRVLVIGCPGSGKSTFSSQLSKASGIPAIHLDTIYWKPGWVSCSEQEFDDILKELLLQEAYIMDGNYGRTLEVRIPFADTVFFFDFPRYVCLYRVFRRTIMNHGKTGEFMGKDCQETIDSRFLKSVWNFRKNQRARIITVLEKYKGSHNIVVFKKPKEVNQYFEDVNHERD